MEILITGGAGFIGSATALELRSRGHSVTVLDSFSEQVHTANRDNSSTWRSIRDHVTLIEGDVRNPELLRDWVPQFVAVLHLAAETGTGQSMYDITHCDVNVGGTAGLLQCLGSGRGNVGNLVVASSRAVYGEGRYQCAEHGAVYPGARSDSDMRKGVFDCRCPVCGEVARSIATTEGAFPHPASVYAVTELSQEQLALVSGESTQLPVTVLRYQNVYGEGQSLHNPYTGILSIFSRELLAGREIEIFEDGLESRDFIHVADVARVNAAALEARPPKTQVLNVGSGIGTTVVEVANTLAAAYGLGSARVRISGRYRLGDIRHNCADISRLRAALGLGPGIAFRDGVARFCAWVLREIGGDTHAAGAYGVAMKELEDRGLMKSSRRE